MGMHFHSFELRKPLLVSHYDNPCLMKLEADERRILLHEKNLTNLGKWLDNRNVLRYVQIGAYGFLWWMLLRWLKRRTFL